MTLQAAFGHLNSMAGVGIPNNNKNNNSDDKKEKGDKGKGEDVDESKLPKKPQPLQLSNKTDEDVTSPMLTPADDNDNEETYTLNYDYIDVTKGGGWGGVERVSNTSTDVHVNLTNVICRNDDAPSADLTAVTNNTNITNNTINTINTNTYATRISKTTENTYGGVHMSNRPVYGDYNSNTYSMKATLGLKDR